MHASDLAASRTAWEHALQGMRTVKPTYKFTLLLVILDRLERGIGSAQEIPDTPALSEEFDQLLERHGELEAPGRYKQPRLHLSTHHRSGPPDRLWNLGNGVLVMQEGYVPVLASQTDRMWLRELILRKLEASSKESCHTLARVTRSASLTPERLALAWHEVQGLPVEFSLTTNVCERLQKVGDLYRQHRGSVARARRMMEALRRRGLVERRGSNAYRRLDASYDLGEIIQRRVAAGDCTMTYLRGERQIRQGQEVFRSRVLPNFDEYCAFCGIGLSALVEAAHILPVSTYPERGLDMTIGIALCRTHHRAFDLHLVGVDKSRIVVSPALHGNQRAAPLIELDGGRVRSPQLPLDPQALVDHLRDLRRFL
jgi:hypothetical protein